ncbi:MAG: transcriptional regulator [Thermoplasmataceae archaeon]
MTLEQSKISELMILANIFRGKVKPSEIGRDIGITLQGVIYHLKILRSEGLINDKNALTKEGFEFLYSGLNDIRSFVHENISELDSALSWEAISDGNIRKGDKVSLCMRDGYLHASRIVSAKPDGATGIAQIDSPPGYLQAVSMVTGLIDIKLGLVTMIVIPNAEDLDNMEAIGDFLKKNPDLTENKKIGIIGETARVVTAVIGITPAFEYASLHSAFESASRGESSTVLVSSRRFHFLLSDIASLETKNPDIRLKIMHLD